MAYETLFDVTTVPFFGASAILIIIVATIFTVFGLWRLSYVDFNIFASRRAFYCAMVVGAGFLYFTMLGHSWNQHRSMQAATSSGEGVKWVEGAVQDHKFTERPRDDDDGVKRIESFRVARTIFEFTQTKEQTSFFTNAADHAVKLHNGMRLRIAYLLDGKSNRILKLEIAR